MSTLIVKQAGGRPSEQFDSGKLHSSIEAACLSARSHDGLASAVANQVCDAVGLWCQSRPEVTSHDIRQVAGQHLEKYHSEAAYLYQQNGLVI